MARTTDIVAYSYRADIYCPGCIVTRLSTPVSPITNVESHLDLLASEIGIDRYEETSFDSGDFPKVVFRDQAEPNERCGGCGGEV